MAGARSGFATQENEERLDGNASKRGLKIGVGRWLGGTEDFSTLVSRTKANAKLVTKRTAQKSTGCTIAQREIPEASRKWEQKSENFKDRVQVAKRYCRAISQ